MLHSSAVPLVKSELGPTQDQIFENVFYLFCLTHSSQKQVCQLHSSPTLSSGFRSSDFAAFIFGTSVNEPAFGPDPVFAYDPFGLWALCCLNLDLDSGSLDLATWLTSVLGLCSVSGFWFVDVWFFWLWNPALS